MDNKKGWFLTAGILVLVGLLLWGVLRVVQTSIVNTVAPVQEMTGNLGTRVAEVLNPTPTILPDPVTIIHQVRSMARLETIQYTVEKVIRAEKSQGILKPFLGDRLLFVAHGLVIAGIDLEKLNPEDLKLDQGLLIVNLPEPEVFLVALDNQKSYVYDRDTGLFTKGDIHLETTARQVAEEEIYQAAIEDGILLQAAQNGETYLQRLFEQLGYPEVIFNRATSTPQP
jgi:hypothetical protein